MACSVLVLFPLCRLLRATRSLRVRIPPRCRPHGVTLIHRMRRGGLVGGEVSEEAEKTMPANSEGAPAPIARAKPIGRPPLTLPDRLTIRTLHDRGFSDAQIARALKLSPSQCREALADARQVLEANAVALVTDYLTASDIAARKGDHRPARDMLDRLDVTKPTPTETTNVGIAVQISGFTLPGLPVQMTSTGQLTQDAPSPSHEPLTLPARPQERE
jgi:hypothetical protein